METSLKKLEKDDEDIIRQSIQFHPFSIQHMNPQLINEELALLAVSLDGRVLQFLPQYANHEKIVKCAIMNNNKNRYDFESASIFLFISQELRNDREFIKFCAEHCPATVMRMESRFRDDREIALIVIRRDPNLLQYVQAFNNDREIVLDCVRRNPFSIRYASEKLRNDEEIVTIALFENDSQQSSDSIPFKYISERLRNDHQLVLNVVTRNGLCLEDGILIRRIEE